MEREEGTRSGSGGYPQRILRVPAECFGGIVLVFRDFFVVTSDLLAIVKSEKEK